MAHKALNRRDFIKSMTLGTTALALGMGCEQIVGSDRPNIIFLLTDDQRWDTMGYVGNRVIKTPNMDDMARNGVLFKNMYVTTSICPVSRASVLTGQHAQRHGIQDFGTSLSEKAFSKTYPALLRRARYRTGFIGKYGVGKRMPAKHFDYWAGFAGQGLYYGKDKQGNPLHLTKKMGQQAMLFLDANANHEPFCLSISFKAPHVQGPNQFLSDPAYDNLYKHATIAIPKTADPKYYASFPEFFRAKNEGRARWSVRFSTPEKYQENVKRYYRLITGVDMVIGQIRKKLKHLGIDNNTILILTSDNGFYLGEHGLAGKWWGHEESIRVPLVIYDPRVPKTSRGQQIEKIALNIDIAPTILSMAGLTPPSKMQGRDLLSLVNGRSQGWRADFFYQHLYNNYGTIPATEGVFGGRYKYWRYINQKPAYEVLYDLKKDPSEERNLAQAAAYKKILKRMQNRYHLLKASSK